MTPDRRVCRETEVGSVRCYVTGQGGDRRNGAPIWVVRIEGYDNTAGSQFYLPNVGQPLLLLLHEALTDFLGLDGPRKQVVEVRVVHVAPAAPALEVKTASAPDPEREAINAIKDEMRRTP